MIKHSTQLSVIALLILMALLNGCIAPDSSASLTEIAPSSLAETPEPQSVIDVVTQAEQSEEDSNPEKSETGKTLAQADQSADSAPLSTPELIEQAYTTGEIDDGERVLNLAYAIYEYDSLPPAYQSDAPWRGTLIVRELNEFLTSPEFCDLPLDVQSELERLLGESTCEG